MSPESAPRRYYSRRVDDRIIAELVGFCEGVISDGVVTDAEAVALKRWVEGHPTIVDQFPARELLHRLRTILDDGFVDDAERDDLTQMLRDLTGGRSDDAQGSSRLPLDTPEPTIFFEDREFCFTGNFALPRAECQRLVLERAGKLSPGNPRRSTNYLVVGAVATEAWVASAWGTKIRDAVEMRSAGIPIAIIAESYWMQTIREGA